MIDGFAELAEGASALQVTAERGDVVVQVSESAGWTLEWRSDGDDAPEVERQGHRVRVRQHSGYGMRRMDLRLTLPPGIEDVELRTGSGRVDAEGLRGTSRLTSGNGAVALRASAGEAEMTSGNGDVVVERHEGTLGVSAGNGRIRLQQVSGEVAARSGNGRIEALDMDGRFRATTGNGDVALAGIGGEVEVKTGHGAIEIGGARGLTAEATTAMGAIRVEGGTVRSLRLKSMVGEVSCDTALGPGRYELETGMGDIHLALPANIAARVEAQTAFGKVQSDFPLVQVGRSGPMGFGGMRMVGSIGAGEARTQLSLRSAKGGITLRRALGEAAAPPPARPRPPEPPRSRDESPSNPALAVLEALARGEITPAEAEDLLSQRT